MERSESVTKLVPALIAAQKSYKPLVKNKTNLYFGSKYADLADVIEATQDALNTNGLTIVQGVDFIEGQTVVHTVLVHESGEYMSQSLRIPGAQASAQLVIAASTYARRGQWVALAGIAADDDMDGNAPESKKQPNPPDRPKVNQKPSTATTAPRPEEKGHSNLARTAAGKTTLESRIVLKMDESKEQAITGATIISGGETTIHTQSTADTPYTKEEYLAVVAPKVKSFYDKADRADILAFIKENSGGKKTEELSRAEWTVIFSKMDEKFGGKQ